VNREFKDLPVPLAQKVQKVLLVSRDLLVNKVLLVALLVPLALKVFKVRLVSAEPTEPTDLMVLLVHKAI
jgi:hypothetical protein